MGGEPLPNPAEVLVKRMMNTNNYDEIIKIFDEEFGDFVDIYR